MSHSFVLRTAAAAPPPPIVAPPGGTPQWEEFRNTDGRMVRLLFVVVRLRSCTQLDHHHHHHHHHRSQYYFNASTNATVWEKPNAPFVPALPEGWEEFFTDDGKAYYFNEAKNLTVWQRPTQ